MAQTPILGAGGIVVRNGAKPLIAIVQRRKDAEWVLPKGKLKRGESAVTAAEREVREETGQDVVVGEFLGAVSYRVGRRPKIVQFWRMQACDHSARTLAKDIKAVKWLPLDSAIRKLTDPLEQVFLQNVAGRSLAVSLAEQGASVESKRPGQPEQPTAQTLAVGERTNVTKPPARKAPGPLQGAEPAESPLAPARGAAEGQIAVLPPDPIRLKPLGVATSARPTLGGRPAPAATKPASASAAGDGAAPSARLNLLDRLLHRLWRERTNLWQHLHWTSHNTRRSGQ